MLDCPGVSGHQMILKVKLPLCPDAVVRHHGRMPCPSGYVTGGWMVHIPALRFHPESIPRSKRGSCPAVTLPSDEDRLPTAHRVFDEKLPEESEGSKIEIGKLRCLSI